MVGRIITNLKVTAAPEKGKGGGTETPMPAAMGRVRRGNSLADMVIGFFEEGWNNVDEEEEGGRAAAAVQEADAEAFWESQHQLLGAALSMSTSVESRLVRVTEKALADSEALEASTWKQIICPCSKGLVASGAAYCRDCRLRAVATQLHAAGYHDCAVCKSKWRNSSADRFPSGEHTYLDVVVHKPNTNRYKGGSVRVVFEPNFRSEFEMARASEAYSGLVASLPEVFVGKADRLRSVVRLVCAAAKRSIKDTGMHVAPWRKSKYMLAKWFSTPAVRMVVGVQQPAGLLVAPPSPLLVAEEDSEDTREAMPRLPKIKASLLTFDLLEKLPTQPTGKASNPTWSNPVSIMIL